MLSMLSLKSYLMQAKEDIHLDTRANTSRITDTWIPSPVINHCFGAAGTEEAKILERRGSLINRSCIKTYMNWMTRCLTITERTEWCMEMNVGWITLHKPVQTCQSFTLPEVEMKWQNITQKLWVILLYGSASAAVMCLYLRFSLKHINIAPIISHLEEWHEQDQTSGFDGDETKLPQTLFIMVLQYSFILALCWPQMLLNKLGRASWLSDQCVSNLLPLVDGWKLLAGSWMVLIWHWDHHTHVPTEWWQPSHGGVLGEGIAESIQVLIAVLGALMLHSGPGAGELITFLLLTLLLGLNDAEATLTHPRQPERCYFMYWQQGTGNIYGTVSLDWKTKINCSSKVVLASLSKMLMLLGGNTEKGN